MPCPTCSHALAGIGTTNLLATILHCPRCGTLVCRAGDTYLETYRPKLVDRCREFARLLIPGVTFDDAWRRLGVAESIQPPEGRS